MLFWYLSHCPVTIWLKLAWANAQTHQSSLSSGENSTQIAEIACAGSRCDLRTGALYECVKNAHSAL